MILPPTIRADVFHRLRRGKKKKKQEKSVGIKYHVWASVRLEAWGLRLSLSGSGLRLAGSLFAEVWPGWVRVQPCGASSSSSAGAKGAMATDITPGAPTDQAKPSPAKPSQASGQAAVSPGRPQAGGPPTTEAQPRCHDGRSECVHHSGFSGARRVWGRRKNLEESRRNIGNRRVDSRRLTAGKRESWRDVVRLRHCGDERMESRVWLLTQQRTDGRKNTSENDTGSKQNCGGNFISKKRKINVQATAFMFGPCDDFHMQLVCHDQVYPTDYLTREGKSPESPWHKIIKSFKGPDLQWNVNLITDVSGLVFTSCKQEKKRGKKVIGLLLISAECRKREKSRYWKWRDKIKYIT